MWTFAAQIPDGYVVAFLSATASLFTLVGAWFFSRIGSHEKSIAILEREGQERDRDLADHENRLRELEKRP